MQKTNWENGTIVKEAFVTIDNEEYVVTPRQIEGNTPLTADNLNEMEDNIETAIETLRSNTNSSITALWNFLKLRHKVLWTGTWSSGSITVTDLSKYHSIIVHIDTSQEPIICFKDNNSHFVGSIIGGTASSFTQWSKTFRCTISSSNPDMITWENSKELSHNPSGNHGSGSAKTVYKIVGLDPIIQE